MLQAEVHNSSDDETLQILVGVMGGLLDRRENVESCPAGPVGHRGQVDQRLDWPIPELLPNPVIFLPHLFVRWVRRPVDAYAPEVFEARRDSAVALIQGGVEFRLQAGDGSIVDQVRGAARQDRQPFFRCRELAGQKLALSPLKLQREGERVTLLPTLLCQQRAAGDKVRQRRGIGCRSLGSLTSNEIEFGDPLSLLQRLDQHGTAIELIDDLEDLLLNFFGPSP